MRPLQVNDASRVLLNIHNRVTDPSLDKRQVKVLVYMLRLRSLWITTIHSTRATDCESFRDFDRS